MALKKSLCSDKQNTSVYNATKMPSKKRRRRRDKRDVGPDFVAPDSGWAWIVCIAVGCSNLAMYPPMQQYGLIYRQRMAVLEFSAKEISTIVNILMSLSSLVGIMNGPLFRRFSFRQVAIVSSLLIFIGILSSAWCTTFWQYVFCLSVIYAIGQGLNANAFSLAVNTYFKNRRRIAIGFTWTITSLGPIIFPLLIPLLLNYYGSQGTILVFAGISLNTLVCAMTLQPVLWHTKRSANIIKIELNESEKTPKQNGDNINGDQAGIQQEYECKYCRYVKRERNSVFPPQFEFDDYDMDEFNYKITEQGTALMPLAGDGWFGSSASLGTVRPAKNSIETLGITKTNKIGGNAVREDSKIEEKSVLNDEQDTVDFYCTCAADIALTLKTNQNNIMKSNQAQTAALVESELKVKQELSFKDKVAQFFDLDLLTDLTLVNLAAGMTVMMFVELNFAIMVPFILDQYGYNDAEISKAMSVQGFVDICVRFLAPLALQRVKISNQILFTFGIVILFVGRILLTLANSFHFILAIFVLIGFGRGFRQIFSALIIPSYVPLKRLPAASGLQLVFSALFTLAFGPILGVITDAFNYTITIHFLNLLTSLALIVWLFEYLVKRILGRQTKSTLES